MNHLVSSAINDVKLNRFQSDNNNKKERKALCHCRMNSVGLFIDVLEFVTCSTDPESVLPEKEQRE